VTLIQEYSYRAIDAAGGGVIKGTLEAASEHAVATKLRTQGLTPLEVLAVSKAGLNRDVSLPGFEKRVKVKELAVFSKQMASLINAGLPLMRTLAILIEQAEDKTLQAALLKVHAMVESGSSLSQAMAAQPNAFPALMVSIVKVGETGGFLGKALVSIAETYEREAELHNKIRSATTYPIIIMIIAMLGVLAMVTFVVPVFENMFKGIGSDLPIPTQILVTASHNMFWILPLLAIVGVAGWMVWVRYRTDERYRKVVDPLKLKMPVFGTLVTKIAVARFARNLSMMLASGVPLIQALEIVAESSNNWKIEQAIYSVQESVRQGRSFAGPLAKAEVFPTMVSQMVSVGEESGTLAEMLESIADFYENEVQTATEQLTSTIEPILLVVIGIVVGGMVISLYLPIFTLYGDLSKTGG
jgi:type II secretory pathway component PulF